MTNALETAILMACSLCGTSGRTAVVLSSGGRRLVGCGACGVRFIDPPGKPDELTAHFTEKYITSEEQLRTTFGDARERVLGRVAAHVKRQRAGGRILDVGCAGGFFLSRYFRENGWETYGVEPSRYAAARAEAKGLKIYAGNVLSADLPPGFFDVVTALDVLYYFAQPQKELQAIRRAMKPGGLLAVQLALAETQILRHATAIGRLGGGTARPLVDGGHLYFYNPRSATYLLREAGFDIAEVVPLPGIRQRSPYQDSVVSAYYLTSRTLWRLSRGRLMLGPNFLVLASPSPNRTMARTEA